MAIQVKRGTEAKRKASSLVLEAGQPLWESDTNKMYVGDGTTQVKSLKPIVAEELSCTPDYDGWPYGAYKITTDGAIRIKSESSNAGVFVDYMGVTLKNRDGESLGMEDIVGFNISTDTLTTTQSKGFKITDSTNTRYIIPDTSSSPASNDSNLLITKDDVCKTQNTYTKPQVHNEEIYVGSNPDSSGVQGYETGTHIDKSGISIYGAGADSTTLLRLSSNGANGRTIIKGGVVLAISASNNLNLDASNDAIKLQSQSGKPTVVTTTALSDTENISAEALTILPKNRTSNNEYLKFGFSSAGQPEIKIKDGVLGHSHIYSFPVTKATESKLVLATTSDIPKTRYLHRVQVNAYNSSYNIYANIDLISDSVTALADYDDLAALIRSNAAGPTDLNAMTSCTGYVTPKSSTTTNYMLYRVHVTAYNAQMIFDFISSNKTTTTTIQQSLPTGTAVDIKDCVISFTK